MSATRATAREALIEPMATPRFLLPSLVWHGLAPTEEGLAPAVGTPTLKPVSWGGLVTSDGEARVVVKTLQRVLLLLNLAGYQVPEVAIGLPTETKETPQAELVAIDMRVMAYARGTQRPWTPIGIDAAQVSLWVEPRYPVAAPATDGGPTLSLLALGDPESIELAFALTGSGWLRLSWPAEKLAAWPLELTALVDRLSGALAEELAAQATAADSANTADAAPLCGLFGLYDARSWRVPDPDNVTPAVQQFGATLAEILDTSGFEAFLAGEVADEPPSVLDRWSAAGAEPTDFANELEAQTRAVSLTPLQTVALVDSAHGDFSDLSVTMLLLYAQGLGLLDFLTAIGEQVAAAHPASVYGGYSLQVGDDDASSRYGGAPRSADTGDPLPPPSEAGYVAQLRRDLAELGFGPLFKYDPAELSQQAFGYDVHLAVRELQAWARMPNLARETVVGAFQFYADGLEQVPNPAPYLGPVSGVVNADTRLLIADWLAARLRCPVVIEARDNDGGKYEFPAKTPDVAWRATDNVWRSEQVNKGPSTVQMFARDFTGNWTLTAENSDHGRTLTDVALGEWDSSGRTGPVSRPRHAWNPEDEMTTVALAGSEIGALGAGGRSTFRVVRACAEVENYAYFESFNSWDSGIVSIGPYHWTLAYAPKTTDPLGDGELPAYLAYLEGQGGDAFEAYHAAYATFGCGVTKSWPHGTSGATVPACACWLPNEAKYASWITLEDEAGALVEVPRAPPHPLGDWFRHWHWCFRFSMAARTSLPFRARMWDYTRYRLRDLLRRDCPDIKITDAAGAKRPARVEEVFTSEKAAALIVRWHVNAPSSVLGSGLAAVLRAAGASAWGDPTTWDDVKQAALCKQLRDKGKAVNSSLNQTLGKVFDWGEPGPSEWTREPFWNLHYDELFNVPAITVANLATPTGEERKIDLVVDWRDPIDTKRTLSFSSSNQSVVADAGLIPGPETPPAALTVKPVTAATGTTTITITADNGAHLGKAAFLFVVDGIAPGGLPPQPAGTTGLSTRHRSFQPDYGGLA